MSALDFPPSPERPPPEPERGDIFERWQWDGSTWRLVRVPGGGVASVDFVEVHIGEEPPESAEEGDLWWDGSRLYCFNEAWVGASAPAFAAAAQILEVVNEWAAGLEGFAKRDGSRPFAAKQRGVAPAVSGDNNVLATAQWTRDRISGAASGVYMPISGGAFTDWITIAGYRPVLGGANQNYLWYSGGHMHAQTDATYWGAVITSINSAAFINSVIAMRLVWAGETPSNTSQPVEPFTHSILTYAWTYAGYRYLQYQRQDGAWYTAYNA